MDSTLEEIKKMIDDIDKKLADQLAVCYQIEEGIAELRKELTIKISQDENRFSSR